MSTDTRLNANDGPIVVNSSGVSGGAMTGGTSKLPLILTLIVLAFIAVKAYQFVQDHNRKEAAVEQSQVAQAQTVTPRTAETASTEAGPSSPPQAVEGSSAAPEVGSVGEVQTVSRESVVIKADPRPEIPRNRKLRALADEVSKAGG
jgi:hypothetical protein